MMNEKEFMKNISETVDFLRPYIKEDISCAIVAGSGLGKLENLITEPVEILYDQIPHFKSSTVAGHAGKLVFGYLGEKYVVLMAGRLHFYEGYTLQDSTFPIRVFQSLAIKNLVLTNAAGGMHQEFKDGAIMLISDHINMMGDSPLVGENLTTFGVRFPSMNDAYTAVYREKMKTIAEKLSIKIFEGVYTGWKGPAYETPAEVRFLKLIGSDAVGMSTIPEVLVAKHGGMKILAMSCITNMAAGLVDAHPTHEEVVAVAAKLSDNMCQLVKTFVAEAIE